MHLKSCFTKPVCDVLQSAQYTQYIQNLMTVLFSCHSGVSTVPLTAQWELLEKGTGCCDCTTAVLVLNLKTFVNNLKIKIYGTIICLLFCMGAKLGRLH